MTDGERATRAIWVKDFTAAIEAIHDEWLVTVANELWILPAYRDEPVVEWYHKLAMVGFSCGWLR